jgi:hypothetical protein
MGGGDGWNLAIIDNTVANYDIMGPHLDDALPVMKNNGLIQL